MVEPLKYIFQIRSILNDRMKKNSLNINVNRHMHTSCMSECTFFWMASTSCGSIVVYQIRNVQLMGKMSLHALNLMIGFCAEYHLTAVIICSTIKFPSMNFMFTVCFFRFCYCCCMHVAASTIIIVWLIIDRTNAVWREWTSWMKTFRYCLCSCFSWESSESTIQ